MRKKSHSVLLFAVFFLLLCGEKALADPFDVSHRVIGYQQNGVYQSIDLQLVVNNNSEVDLHRVKLSPSSREFSSNEQNSQLNIGNLPSMGQAIVNWTINTPVAVEYFQSGMPVFFIIKAKQGNGENVEIPIYSHGEQPL